MNNFFLAIFVAAAFCGGFYLGQKHGAWQVQKQAVERKYGHWDLDEVSGLKSFVWEERQ